MALPLTGCRLQETQTAAPDSAPFDAVPAEVLPADTVEINLSDDGITVDISCSVAPAVVFYNVYECGSTDTETASETVDTVSASANYFFLVAPLQAETE